MTNTAVDLLIAIDWIENMHGDTVRRPVVKQVPNNGETSDKGHIHHCDHIQSLQTRELSVEVQPRNRATSPALFSSRPLE